MLPGHELVAQLMVTRLDTLLVPCVAKSTSMGATQTRLRWTRLRDGFAGRALGDIWRKLQYKTIAGTAERIVLSGQHGAFKYSTPGTYCHKCSGTGVEVVACRHGLRTQHTYCSHGSTSQH